MEGFFEMRRRLTMLLALVLPLAAHSVVALAQPAGKVAATAAASAPPAASAPAASASLGVSPVPSSAGTPAPAVTVDMSARPPPEQAVTGATYAVRLRDLEQRV